MKTAVIAKRLLSLALVFSMLFGLIACARPEKSSVSDTEVNALLNKDEYTREEMELIVDLLGDGQSAADMTDEELKALVDQIVASDSAKDALSNVTNLSAVQKKEPTVDNTGKEEFYGNDGEIKVPFDEIYPELIEKEQVEYADESILVKLATDEITDGLKAAGIAALNEIVPLEENSWYEAKLVKGTDAKKAIEDVRALKEVILAEYNYEINVSAIDDYTKLDASTAASLAGNERFPEQWHFNYAGIPAGYVTMSNKGGLSSTVVAVIDSGVDYDHEDLKDNIWTNPGEIPDNGRDDDGNGFVDDYYGVNLIKGRGNADDDNGHGTHVAGIVAARNNNVGVVGVAYNTKIMPIKAATHNGTLTQSDIARAVLYAYENGAEVINMSFGGTASSIAVQDALAVAYTRCVLVAAAGNSGAGNEGAGAVPNYPAALGYVIGVMSIDQTGAESVFTNWDSTLHNGMDYELYAPGENILSTLPDNRYGYLSGTSMAAPMVSSMAAILRSEFEDRDVYSSKFIYGQLVSTSDYTAVCRDPASHANHASTKIANLNAALTKLPCPDINIQGYTVFDTEDLSNRNNGDGVIDAGEIIALGFTLKNLWGMSGNTVVTVDTKVNGVADPYVTVVNSSVNYGSIGTYATGDCGKKLTDGLHTGWEQPFMVKIANNCPNDYTLTLNVSVTCNNALDPNDKTEYKASTVVTLAVRNGVVLPPVIDEDMVLTKNNLYIVANSTIINEGVTVRVEPGTNIQFWSNDPKDPYANDYIAFLLVNGKFLVEGTKEKPVKIYPSKLMDEFNVEMGASDKGYISLKYAEITNFHMGYDNTDTDNKINLADHCTFRNNYTDYIYCRYVSGGSVSNNRTYGGGIGTINAKSCVFYKLFDGYNNLYLNGAAEKCIFVECGINMNATAKSCVFLGNGYNKRTYYTNGGYTGYNETYYGPTAMTVSSPSSPSISAVYYREETGTTYVRASGLSELLREKMGLSYAIIETPDELDWIYHNNNDYYDTYYNLGIYYNGEKFVWSDGTDIPAFMDPDGVLESASPGNYLSLFLNRSHNHKKLINNSTSYCLYEIPGHVLPTDITFDEYVVNIDTGATYQLSPQNTPVQIPLDAFIYESTDESVVKVSDTGLITPVGQGSASVWVYSLDRAVKNYVNVNVVDYVPLENMSFAASELTVATGELALAKCVFSPIDTTRKQVKYTSDNEAVATVDNAGIVKGIAPGKANITAECEGIKITLPVTVYVRITFAEFAEDVYVGSLADGVMDLPAVSCNEGAEPVYTWRSSDETVARVEDGKLKLLKVGTTTVVVTEEASGISASFDLFVFENLDMKNIRDIQRGYKNNDSIYYVLFEDGSLYAWQNSMPAFLLEGVSLISSDSSDPYFAAVMEDGSIKKCYYNNDGTLSINATISTFSDSHRITDIEYNDFNGNTYHVITDNGNVYAWGDNDYGRLGIGTTSNTNTHTLVNLDGVVDIEVGCCDTWFLTADGELYSSGISTGSSIPVLVDTNVTKIFDNYTNSDGFWYVKNDGQLRYTYESKIRPVTFSGLSEYDDVSVFGGCAIAIKDGMVYYSQSTSSNSNKLEFSDVRPVNGITNVKALYLDRFVITEDGKLYTLHSSSLGIYAKPYGEAVLVPFPTAQMSSESLLLTETSLENGVLIGDTLTVGFNKRLQQAVPKLFANGEQITVKYELCEGNRIKITRAAGFTEGVEYEVIFEKGTMQGLNNTKNAEEFRIAFTYKASEASPETPETPDALPEATPEKEIHEAIVDSSIQRVPTVESFREEISLAQDKYQVNDKFYGNAILNPITTISDPDKWFRPIAKTVSVGTYEEVPLGSNYWGTVSEEAIRLQMTDYTDYINYARLMYDPFLTEAPDNTFPFATDVKLYNAYGEEVTTVGNETVTFRITFNRDMDTTIPLLVKFGTVMGFGEYVVEGRYVDARTWEGTYTLSTLFSNGQQYISISNGCSATEDLELQPDNMRFGFVIDTTAAQALIMQGTAMDTGIELKWTQDDFDTLMGYNVYRSDREDGLYTRLNSTVIPADVMEFFDNTVEPGKVYYYNFTVVKTDLTESEPSGKITIMSKDTMAPDIYHSPVANAFTGANLVINATVTDNLNIAYANLYYRVGNDGEWKIVRMNSLNDKFSAIIIASDVTVEGIQYYIEAFDGVSFTYKGSADAPYRIRVQEAVGADSLGDVNGDGSITIYDALILLYAINDQYNMTAEEFARADLNGDGELWAAEALRILQYVNGTVGSVKMS